MGCMASKEFVAFDSDGCAVYCTRKDRRILVQTEDFREMGMPPEAETQFKYSFKGESLVEVRCVSSGQRFQVIAGRLAELSKFVSAGGAACEMQSRDSAPEPLPKALLERLGQVVTEVATSDRVTPAGAMQATDGRCYRKDGARYAKLEPVEDIASSTPTSIEDSSGRSLGIFDLDSKYSISQVFPEGVRHETQWNYEDPRKRERKAEDCASAGVFARAGVTQVIGGTKLEMTRSVEEALGEGSSWLNLEITRPLFVLGYSSHMQPQEDGKPYVRSVAFGIKVHAYMNIRSGGDFNMRGAGASAGGEAQVNPTAALEGGGIKASAGAAHGRSEFSRQGLVASQIRIYGCDTMQPDDLQSKPLTHILKYMQAKVDKSLRHVGRLQVIAVEVDENVAPVHEDEKILMIGNPGTGKSTLLNGIARRCVFRSGPSLGRGLTYQLDEKHVGARRFMDTPGLADIHLRKQAAQAITRALQQQGWYRIFFVITLQQGRIREEDLATMRCVMEAAPQIMRNSFAIIVNQVGPSIIQRVEAESCRMEFIDHMFLNCGFQPTTHVFFNPHSKDLDDATDKVPELSPQLRRFIFAFRGLTITANRVRAIETKRYEEQLREQKERLEQLAKDMEEQRRAYEAALLESRETAEALLAEEKRKAEERVQHELEAAQRQLEASFAEREAAVLQQLEEARASAAENHEQVQTLTALRDSLAQERREAEERIEEERSIRKANGYKCRTGTCGHRSCSTCERRRIQAAIAHKLH